MVKILLFLSFFCFFQVSENKTERYKLKDVGYISIPLNMEVQSGNYKKFAEGVQKEYGKKFDYEISDNRVVFQQKGLNDLEKEGFSSYARIIFSTEIGKDGEYEKLTTKIAVTNTELNEFDKEVKNQTLQQFIGTKIKIISWYGLSIVTINGKQALKISYLRKLSDRPPVVTDIYQFQNNDRLHTLTMSYRQSDEVVWKTLFKSVLDSFVITNVR